MRNMKLILITKNDERAHSASACKDHVPVVLKLSNFKTILKMRMTVNMDNGHCNELGVAFVSSTMKSQW